MLFTFYDEQSTTKSRTKVIDVFLRSFVWPFCLSYKALVSSLLRYNLYPLKSSMTGSQVKSWTWRWLPEVWASVFRLSFKELVELARLASNFMVSNVYLLFFVEGACILLVSGIFYSVVWDCTLLMHTNELGYKPILAQLFLKPISRNLRSFLTSRLIITAFVFG